MNESLVLPIDRSSGPSKRVCRFLKFHPPEFSKYHTFSLTAYEFLVFAATKQNGTSKNVKIEALRPGQKM